MVKKTFLIFIVLVFLPLAIFSDTVWLKDGSQLNGKILEITKEGILLKSFRGTFLIPITKIKKFEKDPEIEPEVKKPEKKEPVVLFKRQQGMWQASLDVGLGLNGVMADVNSRAGYLDPEPAYAFGFQVAMKGSYFFNSDWALWGGVGFEQNNLKIKWTKDTASEDYEHFYHFDYLNLQLGVKWYWMGNFFASLGFFYSVSLGQPQVEISENGSTSSYALSEKFPEGINGSILGVMIDAGYEWYFNETYFLSSAIRIQGSFSAAFDAKVPNVDSAGTVSPRVYMVLIGFGIIF